MRNKSQQGRAGLWLGFLWAGLSLAAYQPAFTQRPVGQGGYSLWQYAPQTKSLQGTARWFPLFYWHDENGDITHYGCLHLASSDQEPWGSGAGGAPQSSFTVSSTNGLLSAGLYSGPEFNPPDAAPCCYNYGNIDASGETVKQFVWQGGTPNGGEPIQPPQEVNVVSVFSLSASVSGGLGEPSCQYCEGGPVPNVSAEAHASISGAAFQPSSSADAGIGVTCGSSARQDGSPADPVVSQPRQVSLGQQGELTLSYGVSLSTDLVQNPNGNNYSPGYQIGSCILHTFNDAINYHPRVKGTASAGFSRIVDLWQAGDVIYLHSGTALVDGQGLFCDLGCLMPATGQTMFGFPFPALDVAHTGYTRVSSPIAYIPGNMAPDYGPTGFFGLEQIRVMVTSWGGDNDILLDGFYNGGGIEGGWEYHGDLSQALPLLPKIREVVVYDANGIGLRFLGRCTNRDQNNQCTAWQYTPAHGVQSTLQETSSGTMHTFILQGGPPGAMHAQGDWVYMFDAVNGAPEPGEANYYQAYVNRILDPLDHEIAIQGSTSATPIVRDTVTGSELTVGRTSFPVLYSAPQRNISQLLLGTVGPNNVEWKGEPDQGQERTNEHVTVQVTSPSDAPNYFNFMKISAGVTGYPNQPIDQYTEWWTWESASPTEKLTLQRQSGQTPPAFRLASHRVGNLNETTYQYVWLNKDQFQITTQHGTQPPSYLLYTHQRVTVNQQEKDIFTQAEYRRPSLSLPGEYEKTIYQFDPLNGQVARIDYYPTLNTPSPTWTELFTYHPDDLLALTQYTDREGNLWTFEYDTTLAETLLTRATDPTGVSTLIQYGQSHPDIQPPHTNHLYLPTTIKDNAGNEWRFDYNATTPTVGLLTGFSEPNRPWWTLEYYPLGHAYQNQLMRVGDPTGREVRITNYDDLGRPSRWEVTTDVSQNTQIWQEVDWTWMGQPRTVRDGQDLTTVSQTDFTWDGRFLREVKDPRGRVAHFDYNKTFQGGIIHPANLIDDAVTGLSGQLTHIWIGTPQNPRQQLFAWLKYDNYGRLEKVKGGNGVGIQYTYGNRDELRQVLHDGDSAPEVFEYSCCGRVSRWTKPNGQFVDFEYDKNGALTKIFLNGETNPSYQYCYDRAGRPIQFSDPTGSTQFCYDVPISTLCNGVSIPTCYEIGTGRLKQVTTALPIGNYTLTYTYLPSGEVQQVNVQYPNGGSTTWGYQYDSAGRLTDLTYNSNALARWDYDNAGRLKYQYVYPLSTTNLLESTLTYADDQSVGAVGLLTYKFNGQTVAQFDYRGLTNDPGYYTDGTLRFAQESVSGTNRTWRWEYHPDGSLQYENLNGTQTNFLYDAGGNLFQWNSETWNYGNNQLLSVPARGWYYSYNASGERATWLVSTQGQPLQGDANGDGCVDKTDQEIVEANYGQTGQNIPGDVNHDGVVNDDDRKLVELYLGATLTYYQYDVWGNLIEVTSCGSVVYRATYDGLGRRVWQEIYGVRTYFIYDGDTIIAELDSAGNLIAEYGWGLLGPVMQRRRANISSPWQSRYYLQDALGHPRLLLDKNGTVKDRYTYDAWGNLIEQTGNTVNPFRWNGAYGYEYIPFTGLYHVGAREYDPRTARWLQRDPVGLGGGSPNTYLYCLNNPLMSADPTGLQQDTLPDEGIIEFDEDGHPIIYKQVQQGINKRIVTPLKTAGEVAASLNPVVVVVEAGCGETVSREKMGAGERILIFATLGKAKVPKGFLARIGAWFRRIFHRPPQNPLANIVYKGSAKQKMRNPGDPFHSFPPEVDNFGRYAQVSKVRGGDGKVRTLVQLHGEYRGYEGYFEWILEPDGKTCTHRMFRPIRKLP